MRYGPLPVVHARTHALQVSAVAAELASMYSKHRTVISPEEAGRLLDLLQASVPMSLDRRR